jgi:chemotaxis regulatin CheY-phosphate phosphatase CheZ
MHNCPAHGWITLDADVVSIPARAREEIGQLSAFLERVRANLLQVNVHVQGSSETVPRVLNELKDIVQMTEAATLRVLEETEALLEEGQTLSGLVGQAQQAASDGALPEVSGPLSEVQGLVDRGNDRVMAIMSALEFQDLTTQKIQRAFEVLEEVANRLGKIHQLVSLGQETAPDVVVAAAPEARREGKSGQDLADEILSRFRG